MEKNYSKKFIFLVSLFIFINGCVRISESSKIFWGSSTKALEQARKDAFVKTYECQYSHCFDEVIRILEEGGARVFVKDKAKHTIVAMEIKDCISTTEVGIFFIEGEANKIKIEISSLSPKTKRITSELIFQALDATCNINL